MNFNRMMDKAISVMDDDWERDFGAWKAKVNEICIAHFGLSAEDLPDANWADYHHDNMTPVVAIDTAILDAWYDMPELETLWYGENYDG